jgi:hypothetical protein
MKNTSVRISEKTQEKLNLVKARMLTEKILHKDYDGGTLSWDVVYDKMADHYLGSITPLLDSKARDFEAGRKIFEEFRKEVLQKLEDLKYQNNKTSLELISIQNFLASLNENLRELMNTIRSMFSNVADVIFNFKEIERKIRVHIGIATAFIMHYVIRDNNIIGKKVSPEEATKEISKVVNNYRNLWNKSSHFPSEEIDKVFDKLAMKKED